MADKNKNFLLEILQRPFLKRPEEDYETTSTPRPDNVEASLDDVIPTGFFDNQDGLYISNKKEQLVQEQNKLIEIYRRIANTPEVSDAINEIVDEAIFSVDSKDLIEIDFQGEIPDNAKDKIIQELKTVLEEMNIDKNIYNMFKTFYIDGQLSVHCSYDKDNLTKGILKYKMLSPMGLQFNYSKDQWEYVTYGDNNYSAKKVTDIYDREEIIRIDSGVYADNLILSNLHPAIKPANMLSTLEDMLIPMRFTRSVSRRVFNVDVSKLNAKKAEEVMKKIQAQFKYSKFYDLETGTISNQQHVTSLTEDYWFPNRGGEKGTTVDTIDETGNLGEIEDILYFKRKLYTSLKVPTNRLNDDGPSGADFDYDTTSINREEIKFFNFVTRLRNQFLELFYEILKRNVISKGIALEDEWEYIEKSISIRFSSENKFFEKMQREHISESLNLFRDVEELAGKYFSYNYIFKNVFKMSDDDINTMLEEIEKEKTDPKFKKFYDEDKDSGW
jgi:hypothetical protein